MFFQCGIKKIWFKYFNLKGKHTNIISFQYEVKKPFEIIF